MKSLMETGQLKQKANPVLVGFVFACVVVIVGLLYISQKSFATADNLSSITKDSVYAN